VYIIGSRALACHAPRNVEEKDWDFVLEGEALKQSQDCDLAPQELCTLEVCRAFGTGLTTDTPYGEAKLPSLTALMLIKRSHLHRPLGFEKNIRDYHEMKSIGISYDRLNHIERAKYDELLKKLTKQTKDLYGDRVPSLRKSKTEFFDDYVTKVFDHDEIHLATCYGPRPIFERLKPSGDESVWCDKSLWDGLSHQDKIRCVREEAFVISLERFIIPNLVLDKPHRSAKMAFGMAVSKICTTLCSGWFRDFAIENWPQVMNYDLDFLEKFHEYFGSRLKRSDCFINE
jgi:hypothetical protein